MALLHSHAAAAARRSVLPAAQASAWRVAARRFSAAGRLELPTVGEPASGKPDLYIYDLCPFCTRARMIFGFKGAPHRLKWLSYDDAATPTALIGKKLAPILHIKGEKPMGESLDIVRRIDEDPAWGPPLLQPATGREDLKQFEKELWPLMRRLLHPRFLRVYLPELAQVGGREYFIRQHPIDGPNGEERPSKEEWDKMGDEMQAEWYDQSYLNSVELIEGLNDQLPILEKLIHSETSVSDCGLSYDDILFFCRIRPITIVKGIKLGPKAKAYLESMSMRTDIPLLTSMKL